MILIPKEYDIVFHIVIRENDILRNKLADKFGILGFSKECCKIKRSQYARLMSTQYANKLNEKELKECIELMLKNCTDNSVGKMAINVDYDDLRHYLDFKDSLVDTFKNTNILTTLYLNRILFLNEREDVDKILELYHKSLLGGHNGTE